MSHRACRCSGAVFNNKFGGYSRDLDLFLLGIRIAETVKGHMRTEERWPTSVFHECRQREGFLGGLWTSWVMELW